MVRLCLFEESKYIVHHNGVSSFSADHCFVCSVIYEKKAIPVIQILRDNLIHIIDENAPKIHIDPFTVYYRMKFANNSDKFGAEKMNETRMRLPNLKNVWKQILASPISVERITAVKRLHSSIIHY